MDLRTDLARLLDDAHAAGGDPGTAVCVVRDGDVVAEHHVGTRGDRPGSLPWDAATLVMTYSVAKPFAALTVLDVVAAGGLGLDQRVVEVWPGYARAGSPKAATTVRHVLSHAAGLPCFPPGAADVPFDDRDALVALLEAAEPVHPPGEAVAEHALTYGHLCDELVRRATGGDLADRFAALAAEHGWDLHLRVPPAERHRVADLVALDPGWAGDYLADPRWGPALGRPAGLLDPAVLNGDRFRGTSFPAIALHASARGLARFYDDLMTPGGPVATRLGPDAHAALTTAQASGHDLVLDRHVAWTCGLQVDDDELGMGGAGGCSAWWSYGRRHGAAYLTRGLGGPDRAEPVWQLVEGTTGA
ncbi:serine hydrolase domain-containing protein [Nocardioides marinquilinus]|uniref:serine hydrolase domain-containing protein n=1 Tax=Nocardioides marinquilinus TaxID=1210400 RepID=UPI0031E751C8